MTSKSTVAGMAQDVGVDRFRFQEETIVMAMTSIGVSRQLTPRLFFDGALAGCTVALGTVLAVEALGALSLSGQGQGQVLGFAGAILLCVIGVLFGDGARRGDLGRGVATLVAASLGVVFALACVPSSAP